MDDCKAVCSGCIAGIVIGCLVVGALLGVLFITFVRKRRKNKNKINSHDKSQKNAETVKNKNPKTTKVASEKAKTTNKDLKALELLLYEDIHPRRIKIQIELDLYKTYCSILSVLNAKTNELYKEYLLENENKENNVENFDEEKQILPLIEEQLFSFEELFQNILYEIEKTKKAAEVFDKKIQEEILPIIKSWKQTLKIDFKFISTLISYKVDVHHFSRTQKHLERLLKTPYEQLNTKSILFFYSLYKLEKHKSKILLKVIEDLNSMAKKRMKRFEKLTFQRETQKLKWNYDIATMINLVTMTKKRSYIDEQKHKELVNQVLKHMKDYKEKIIVEKDFDYKVLGNKIKLKQYDIKNSLKAKSKENGQQSLKTMVLSFIKAEKEFDEKIMTDIETLNKSYSTKIEKEINLVKENTIISLIEDSQVNELWLNDQIRSIEELKPNKTYRSSTKHYEAVPFFLNLNKSQMKLIKIIQKKFCDESSKMKYNFSLCKLFTLFSINTRQTEYFFKKKTSNLLDEQKKKLRFLQEIPNFEDLNEDELFDQVDIKHEIFQLDSFDLFNHNYNKNFQFPNTELIFNEIKPKIFKLINIKNEQTALEKVMFEILRSLMESKIINTLKFTELLEEYSKTNSQVKKEIEKFKKENELKLSVFLSEEIKKVKMSESKEKEIFKTENLFYCSQNTLVTQKKIIKQKNQSLKKLTELHLELHHKKLKKLHENTILTTRLLAKIGKVSQIEVYNCLRVLLPRKDKNYYSKMSTVVGIASVKSNYNLVSKVKRYQRSEINELREVIFKKKTYVG